MTHGKVGRLVWGWYHVFAGRTTPFFCILVRVTPFVWDTCRQTHLDVESPEFLKDRYIYIYKWWVLNVYIDLLESLFGFTAMFKSYSKHVENTN